MFVLILLMMGGSAVVRGQTNIASEYQVKAVFLYNFTHFIDWPLHAFESQYAYFVIGVIGNDPLAPYIQQAIENERVGKHVIRVQRFNSVREIKNCHMLYISSSDPVQVKEILDAVARKSILTIGDTPNFTRWGGMIRFYKEHGKIRLQINNASAKASGLKISSKLLRLAEVV